MKTTGSSRRGPRKEVEMSLSRRVAVTMLVVLAATLSLSTSMSSAYRANRGAPRVLLRRATPPTTAECEAEFEIACYDPSQVETAYNMKALYAQGDEGQGETIVIVDSFGSPTIEKDLKKFDKAFHLPAPPSFKVIQPAGAVKPFEPGNAEMSGWAGETTIDVEWAHSMAPQASILLVETPEEETEGVQGFPQIVQAENYVIEHNLGQVISQSFSATEQSFPNAASILALRSATENAATHDVTMLDAAGDEGVAGVNLAGEYFHHKTVSWPASDPLETGIGGTQLHLNEEGQRTSPDTVWDEFLGDSIVAGAGGESKVFARPEYQELINTHSGQHRAVPDISMTAAVNGGIIIYSSYPTTVPGEPEPGTFSVWGGTSVATPVFSGVVAIADQIAGHPLGLINPRMYQMEKEGEDAGTGIVDVTSGNNTFVELNEEGVPTLTIKGYEAKKGYDMASGLGTVDGFEFAHALAAG
jgi:subtilase family serine protease